MDPEAFVFFRGRREQKSAVHQRITGIFLPVYQVDAVCLQSLQTHPAAGTVRMDLESDDAQKRFASVRGSELPSMIGFHLIGIGKPVIISVLDEVIIFLEFPDLSFYNGLLLFGHLIDVQLISERTGHCNRRPGI